MQWLDPSARTNTGKSKPPLKMTDGLFPRLHCRGLIEADADTFYFNLSTQLASRLGVYRFKSSFASSDSPRFRLAVKNQSAGATNYVGLTYFIFVNNLTRVGDQFTTLT